MKTFIKNKVIQPFIDFLKMGISPEKLALSLALGATIGIIPVLGVTTILCAGLAVVFRINPVSIQMVNYLVYPLQLVLFIPLLSFGQSLTSGPEVPQTIGEIITVFKSDWLMGLKLFGLANLWALLIWALLSLPLGLTLYLVFRNVFRKLQLIYS